MKKKLTNLLRLTFQIIITYAVAVTAIKELYGLFGVVVVAVGGTFYFINEYRKESE
jgi:hypothetical protein